MLISAMTQGRWASGVLEMSPALEDELDQEEEAMELELFDPRNPGLPTLPPPTVPPAPMPNLGVPDPLIIPVCPTLDVPIRHFECPLAALARIQTATGVTMTQVQVLEDVRDHVRGAVCVAAYVAAELEGRNSKLIAAFRESFGVSPDSIPSWRTSPGGWSHGRIVRQRFLGARRLLASSAVLYSCWGRPRHAGGPEPDPDYFALAQPGGYWIALGRRYWQASHYTTRTYAYLLAALRAYYGPLLSDAPLMQSAAVRLLGNAHCYIRFVIQILNSSRPAWVEEGCPSGGFI
jgi:hypothetical protein